MAHNDKINGIFPSLVDDIEEAEAAHVHHIERLPVNNIQRFCRDIGATHEAFIQTVWAIVIRPFLEADIVCFGFCDHCEDGPSLPKAIQADIPPDTSFVEVLKRGFAAAEEGIRDGQALGHNTAIIRVKGSAGIDESKLLGMAEQGSYVLCIVVQASNEGALMGLSLVYKASTLSSYYAENISSTIIEVVEGILRNSNQGINDLSLFSPLNRSQVLRWNSKKTSSQSPSIVEVIHKHACERPHHPAICAWDGVISYAELDTLSSQWASYLNDLGIDAESMVPIMMDSSKWIVVAELAVLKSGGAFVPLDPLQPDKRLQDMVQQINATVGLSHEELGQRLSSLVGNVVIVCEETTSSLPTARWTIPPRVAPESTGYVLFTSGSTGHPKGCVVSHGALANVVDQTQSLRINADSRVLQFASYGFGVSLIEIYCTLGAGATICIPPKKEYLNDVNAVMDAMQITWAILTPSAASALIRPLVSLKTLVLAGEPMRSDLFHTWAQEAELLQGFGFTEWAGICCVSEPIVSLSDLKIVGNSPTANLWLLDPTNHNRLAPVGAVAELLVEGPALARGYLNNSAQTRSVFADDAAWLRSVGRENQIGTKLYKSGDLVQYCTDGSIKYVARKDTQVKIRGKRLELGEIEYQAHQAGALVDKVIVEVAAPKDSQAPIVVAFLCSPTQDAPSNRFESNVALIEDFLEKMLPDYMWPAIYMPLTAVPLTATGKTDRRALRTIIQTSTRQQLEGHYSPATTCIPPATELELKLHQLFAETLQIAPSSFGIKDSFVRLGGDSATAMRLANRARQMNCRLTVQFILQHQSISNLAQELEKGYVAASSSRHLDVAIPKTPYAGPVEQSFAQRQLWFLDQLHPGSTSYLLPFATRLRGQLNLSALGVALGALVERHEPLRTTFNHEDGTDVQIIHPFKSVPLNIIDMTRSDKKSIEEALRKEQSTAFDLAAEPGWRTSVFCLGPEDHVLSIVMHHIISDGWSVDILRKELSLFYSTANQGQSPLSQVRPLPTHYRDFSNWERQREEEKIRLQVEYWVRELEGSKPAELLYDKKRPSALSGAAGIQKFDISGNLHTKLLLFCKIQQTTTYNVLLAAFRAAQYRLTGAEDVIIGTPTANRNREELEGLIGFFVNLQCVRTTVEDRTSFRGLVQQIQSKMTVAFANQDVHFEEIVTDLYINRDLSRNPLIQLLFAVHSQKNLGQFSIEGVEAESLSVSTSSSFDLEFHLYQSEGCMDGEILFALDLFEPQTITVLLSVFCDVLQHGLTKPDEAISRIPLTDAPATPQDRRVLGIEEAHSYPRASIVEVFQEQSERQPDKVAVKDTSQQLTYRELDTQSGHLAAFLMSQSFTPETVVGVLANRCCETIIAFLGILKAGLAYLPLDIQSPPARLETILSSVPSCRLVLLGPGVERPALGQVDVQFVPILVALRSWRLQIRLDSAPVPGPASLAYVLFTSGSTGKPKGVMVQHRGIVRLTKSTNVITPQNAAGVMAHITNITFDVSAWEIYTALLNGGTLICVDAITRLDYKLLGEVFRRERVHVAILTPVMLKQCLIECPSTIGYLEMLFVAGDRLDPPDAMRARELVNGKVINAYGPTENTVFSTIYTVQEHEQCVNGLPIGRTVSHSGAYVMDPCLRLVPRGVVGELVVTGDGVARGYTDPELDRGRFVAVDIPGQPETKAYRTGDYVRYRPSDGELEFFGRMDQQVKVRGHRIELVEIDHLLHQQKEVSDAVTVVQRREGQEPELVSFVTVQAITTQIDLEGMLENQLPPYMVPCAIIVLDRLPINSSGKIDRQALSRRDDITVRQESTTGKVPPRDELERALCEEFHNVLGIEMGITDSFFKVGGHSLLATRTASRVSKRLNVQVTVRDIFEFPTIAGLAERIHDRVGTTRYVSISPVAYSEPVQMSYAQGRLWVLHQLHPRQAQYHMPFAVRLRGPLHLDALQTAFSTISRRHEILRTTFRDDAGRGVQVVHPFQPLKRLTVVEMSQGNDRDLAAVLRHEQTAPFDLTAAPGWRVAVIRLGGEDHVLSLVVHHILCDGWSVGIIQRELAMVYAAAVRRQLELSECLHPLPIQYHDFARWQREAEQTHQHQQQLEYWTCQLESSRPAAFLCDKPRPAVFSGSTGREHIRITDSLYEDLIKFCKTYQFTPLVVLLTAFRITHYRLTGSTDAAIGVPVANRNRHELEDLIGFFVNLQCIRIPIADETFHQLVQKVHSATVTALANQDVPFEQIVGKLQKERDLSRNPLVQLVFAVHSELDLAGFHLEGVETEPVDFLPPLRFDMEFHLYQKNDALEGYMLYAESLFTGATIEVIRTTFYAVLQSGVGQPLATPDSLPLAANFDFEKLAAVRCIDYPRGSSVIEVFQQQVAAHRNHVAVKHGSAQLTYSELDHQSDRVASWLAARSWPAETPVAVFANRSCETIVAFLGILKAHLAYLPLDTRAPAARIDSIISSISTCTLILTGLQVRYPGIPPHGITVIPIAQAMTHPVQIPVQPSPTSLAYIMFTSGSTGKPKGVMVEHRGIVRLVKNSNVMDDAEAASPIAHLSSLAFDASTWEIYAPLLNGGSVICVDLMTVLGHDTLGEVFREDNVQIAMFTPALLKEFLTTSPDTIGMLHTLIAAGDRLDPDDMAKARRLVKCRMLNAYGPTENTVFSTIYPIPPGDVDLCINGVAIGHPVSNSGACIVDRGLRPVPIGVIGELVVTGDGLARGYTDPGLNEGRFITLKIGSKEERGYRTGDLVRYRPGDHQLEYFKRVDHQVKIHGHRVELGEIDHSLLSHSFVRDAITILRKRDNQHLDPELVSFITVHEGQDMPFVEERENKDGNGQMKAWADLFDTNIYELSGVQPEDLGRDFVGWKSMYDGEMIDKAEMAEWLDDTIAALSGALPGHVFEVGTGSGMILFNIVDGLKSYVGLEPSGKAVKFVQGAVNTVPSLNRKVQIHKGTADRIPAMDRTTIPTDLAIINSVAQYFPSPEYLLKVIQDLVQLQGAKYIFLGDLRSYALYEQFQVSKALHRRGVDADLHLHRFQQETADAARIEEELLVDPAFFTALPSRFPDLIAHVEILPKRMTATNELSCYRYAAVLHTAHRQAEKAPVHIVDEGGWLDFSTGKMHRLSLLEHLQQQTDSSVVAISNIPYSKTMLERLVLDLVHGRLVEKIGQADWLESLRKLANDSPSLAPVDLVELANLTDAIFHRINTSHRGARVLFQFPTDHQGRRFDSLSNNPLQLLSTRTMEIGLRRALQEALPFYMVPKMVRILKQLPVNNNGKVDRKALAGMFAAPAKHPPISAGVAPHDTLEHVLLAEFTRALGSEIGTSDSFFDHGGHSLMAMKLVTHINRQLHTSIRISDVFASPTVIGLAEKIRLSQHSHAPTVACLPFSLVGGTLPTSFESELLEIGLPPSEVLDIIPVTDMQAWFLDRWDPVSVRFNIQGEIDVDRLRAACLATTQQHSILRTVFTNLEGRPVQLILRALDASFIHHSTMSASQAEPDFYGRTRSNAPTAPVRVFTGFQLVSHSPTEHSFVIRLSHAQYDGFSLPLLLDVIKASYHGTWVLSASSSNFSDYVYGSRSCRSADSFKFWQDYLQGASLTNPIPPGRRGKNTAADTNTKGIAAGDLTSLPQGITFPTLVNAALAFTLAQKASSDDITIGLTIHTRDTPIGGVETILGPCIARAPLRVQLQPHQTVSDLCQRVHDSYTAISRHGHIELSDIITKCSNWPPSSDFGCMINHIPTDSFPSFELGDAVVSPNSMDTRVTLPDQILVRSIVSEKRWEVQVLTSSTAMDNIEAASLASRIVKTTKTFSRLPEATLSSLLLG
ncbi:acetyl-CoA synthetase-like protein [Aspergillus californicus]